MSTRETPFEMLMGQIGAMKRRADQYAREAEMDAEIGEADKHMRVFCVLKELERLGNAFNQPVPAKDRTGLEWWEDRPDCGTGGVFRFRPVPGSGPAPAGKNKSQA